MRRALAILVAMLSSAVATAQPPVKVYAAGSLRAALEEVGREYTAATGNAVTFEFGPSGLLRDRLAGGERADVFASANMEHPRSLADAGKASAVRMFARNRLCALAPIARGLTTANLLDRLLDPAMRVGTSTPKADPSGDYAWEVFRRADTLRTGSFEVLSKKALQLVGGPGAQPAPVGRSAYGSLVAGGKVDVFLTYCTNAVLARREEPSLDVIDLPPELSVGAEYGLVTMRGAPPAADAFAQFLLGPGGLRILARAGFGSPARDLR